MKGTGKKVLFISAVAAVTVGITYSTVMAVRSNNEALNKVAEGSQITETTDFTDGLNDGEYEGTADGYGGPITVRITIKDGKLTDIVIVSHSETPEYFDKANAVINEILKSGSVNVDAVSGATITSNAIKKAVSEALQKAGFKKQIDSSQANNNIQDIKDVSTDSLNDGEYEGTAVGYGGSLTVRVTINGGNITNIIVLSHQETPEYYKKASVVINRILSSGNVNVDGVSGATVSSNAIKKAVANAIRKAGFKQQANVLSVEKDNKTTNNVKGNVPSSFFISKANINDGVFMGTSQGFNGPIRVRVTIS